MRKRLQSCCLFANDAKRLPAVMRRESGSRASKAPALTSTASLLARIAIGRCLLPDCLSFWWRGRESLLGDSSSQKAEINFHKLIEQSVDIFLKQKFRRRYTFRRMGATLIQSDSVCLNSPIEPSNQATQSGDKNNRR